MPLVTDFCIKFHQKINTSSSQKYNDIKQLLLAALHPPSYQQPMKMMMMLAKVPQCGCSTENRSLHPKVVRERREAQRAEDEYFYYMSFTLEMAKLLA